MPAVHVRVEYECSAMGDTAPCISCCCTSLSSRTCHVLRRMCIVARSFRVMLCHAMTCDAVNCALECQCVCVCACVLCRACCRCNSGQKLLALRALRAAPAERATKVASARARPWLGCKQIAGPHTHPTGSKACRQVQASFLARRHPAGPGVIASPGHFGWAGCSQAYPAGPGLLAKF